MKTLDEHNKERLYLHKISLHAGNPRLNGIECPECGTELFDTNPMETLTSNPPQKNIHCAFCKYTGYRIE